MNLQKKPEKILDPLEANEQQQQQHCKRKRRIEKRKTRAYIWTLTTWSSSSSSSLPFFHKVIYTSVITIQPITITTTTTTATNEYCSFGSQYHRKKDPTTTITKLEIIWSYGPCVFQTYYNITDLLICHIQQHQNHRMNESLNDPICCWHLYFFLKKFSRNHTQKDNGGFHVRLSCCVCLTINNRHPTKRSSHSNWKNFFFFNQLCHREKTQKRFNDLNTILYLWKRYIYL